jgi:hypothetical protein
MNPPLQMLLLNAALSALAPLKISPPREILVKTSPLALRVLHYLPSIPRRPALSTTHHFLRCFGLILRDELSRAV